MELIYHLPEKKGSRSPFDEAVEKVVKNEQIKIACPYIGLSYFKEAIQAKCQDFRLLTDINELFAAFRTKNDINSALDFIINNQHRIKHYSNLHSKVIISSKKAFFGSSNLTFSGITNNNELSVLVDDLEKVNELNNWFDLWWQQASDIDTEELKTKLHQYKIGENVKPKIRLLKNNNTIRSSYKTSIKEERISKKIDSDFLKSIIRHVPNKEWLISYCDLVYHILNNFNIKEDDKRLCISCKSSSYKISITIGQRYVIYPGDDDKSTINLIMPKDFDETNAEKEGKTEITYFTKHYKNDVPWVHYKKNLFLRD